MIMKNFFHPKTIAVIGASDNPEKVGNVLIRKLCECKRKVIPINIKRESVLGKKAYPSILKYPGSVVPAGIVNGTDNSHIAGSGRFPTRRLPIFSNHRALVSQKGYPGLRRRQSRRR